MSGIIERSCFQAIVRMMLARDFGDHDLRNGKDVLQIRIERSLDGTVTVRQRLNAVSKEVGGCVGSVPARA